MRTSTDTPRPSWKTYGPSPEPPGWLEEVVIAPLEGLSVVEGTAFVAAPSGGMALAQLGADVIRFDQVG